MFGLGATTQKSVPTERHGACNPCRACSPVFGKERRQGPHSTAANGSLAVYPVLSDYKVVIPTDELLYFLAPYFVLCCSLRYSQCTPIRPLTVFHSRSQTHCTAQNGMAEEHHLPSFFLFLRPRTQEPAVDDFHPKQTRPLRSD